MKNYPQKWMTPEEAYFNALQDGPHKDTRQFVLESPSHAYRYALNIDAGPREDTRNAVLGNPAQAYLYARDVDCGPRPGTRNAVLRSPSHAYHYALEVDEGPREDTRYAALWDSEYAYRYAKHVDEVSRKDTWDAVRGTKYESEYIKDLGAYVEVIEELKLKPEPEMTPEEAYDKAVKEGPSDETRQGVLASPYLSYLYALDIDEGPHDDTRQAALGSPEYAFYYARNIDKEPREDTWKAAHEAYKTAYLRDVGHLKVSTPEEAYNYAVTYGASATSRDAVLTDPIRAFNYACVIDEGPREDTRKAVLGDPELAYSYAHGIDKGPRDDTRQAVLADPRYAYYYARNIDKEAHIDTWTSVLGTKHQVQYTDSLGEYVSEDNTDPDMMAAAEALDKGTLEGPSDETRQAVLRSPHYAYHYATEVDKGPHDDTRQAVVDDEFYAYEYAMDVDGLSVPEFQKARQERSQEAGKQAYEKALVEGPSDETRDIVRSGDPEHSYLYALNVDLSSRDGTRVPASRKSPKFAYLYALSVDKGPHDETRRGALKDPEYTYRYARDIDQGPREDTRKAVLKSPYHTCLYARHIDKVAREDTWEAVRGTTEEGVYFKVLGYSEESVEDMTPLSAYNKAIEEGPSKATRQVVLESPQYTYYYARDVDNAAREDTRNATLEDPCYAYYYARYVDRGVHKATWGAVLDTPFQDVYSGTLGEYVKKMTPEAAYLWADVNGPSDQTRKATLTDPSYAYLYARDIDKAPRDDTRIAALADPQWAYCYAVKIDKVPRDDTWEAVQGAPTEDTYKKDVPGFFAWFDHPEDITPKEAYHLAEEEGPSDETRETAAQDASWAFAYARDIDKVPHDDTWESVKGTGTEKYYLSTLFRDSIHAFETLSDMYQEQQLTLGPVMDMMALVPDMIIGSSESIEDIVTKVDDFQHQNAIVPSADADVPFDSDGKFSLVYDPPPIWETGHLMFSGHGIEVTVSEDCMLRVDVQPPNTVGKRVRTLNLSALKTGTSMAGANQTNEAVYRVLKAVIQNSSLRPMAEHPMMEHVIKLLVPNLILGVATATGFKKLDRVEEFSDHALTFQYASGANAVIEALGPFLKLMVSATKDPEVPRRILMLADKSEDPDQFLRDILNHQDLAAHERTEGA